MALDLYSVQAKDLHTFIYRYVQPDADFLNSCHAVVDRLVHFLQNNIPGRLRPRRVIKAGSLGKGTAVRNKSDVDLILMLASYTSVEALMKDMGSLLDELKRYLVNYGEAQFDRITKYSVQVKVTAKGISQSVDILPGVDMIDRGLVPAEIYHKMERPGANLHEYSVTLGPLQVQIISGLPSKVKDLIRLIKYWEDEKMKSVRNKNWPSSYTLELVVLNSWNEAGCPEDFEMLRALHAVLVSLVNHGQFCVKFPRQMKYSATMLRARPHPYIMDPTNPFNDMYHGLLDRAWDWDDVAMEASVWLRNPIFSNVGNTKARW